MISVISPNILLFEKPYCEKLKKSWKLSNQTIVGVVAPDRVLSMGQIELWFWELTVFTFKRHIYDKLNWDRTDYLYKIDLALNNLQRLICRKSNQPNHHPPKPGHLLVIGGDLQCLRVGWWLSGNQSGYVACNTTWTPYWTMWTVGESACQMKP